MEIAILLGSLLALFQFVSYFLGKSKFSSLPVCEGTINRSKVKHQTGVDGKQVYEADICFTYRVEGVEYESEKAVLRSFQLFPNYEYETSIADKYNEGDKVDVRYLRSSRDQAYIAVAPLSVLSTAAMVFGLGLSVLLLILKYSQ